MMKRIAFLFPLLISSAPAFALTDDQKSAYTYGFEFGWLSHSCMLYTQGTIDRSAFEDDILLVKNDKENPPFVWRSITKSFRKMAKQKDWAAACNRVVVNMDTTY